MTALVLACALFSTSAHAVTIQQVIGEKTGVKAWLVEDHKLPLIALQLAFRGGSEQDPVDKQGLSTLTMNALTEGAGPYDAAAFQQQLSDRSISLGLASERDELAGGLKCLSADKTTAFKLLHLALTQPRFETADIERLRGQQLAALRQQYGNPNWQARFALFSQIFAGHPYSERHLGSAQTLASITRDDIVGFTARHLARDNLIVAVAGDITPEELSKTLDAVFDGLPARAQLTPIADVQEPTDTQSILVKREGTQTDMLFAMPGPRRADPEWYAVDIANYILGGGGFSSRLMQDVRDKKGLTYGISTSLSPADHDGLIIGQSAVDNPKVSEALETMRETMQRFHDEGVTAKEISAAKDYLTGSQPLALTSTDKIAEILITLQRENLGSDYLDRYGDIIRGVTPKQIAKAIDHWFNPERITWVMVGKPEGVTATIAKDTVRQ